MHTAQTPCLAAADRQLVVAFAGIPDANLLKERSRPSKFPRPILKGSKALVIGVANDQSIAYGCAKAFRELGADSRSPISTKRRGPTSSRSRARSRPALPAARRRVRARSKRCSTR
jgi:hypothetical protein